jgi:glycoside hydrolase-like protein/LysM domain-containing protein
MYPADRSRHLLVNPAGATAPATECTGEVFRMSHKVLDYSFARFTAAQVHDLGAMAVCRYLTVVTADTRGKLLTRDEAEGLSAAGIGIVSVFEFGSQDALGGYHQGKEYAALAAQQHAAAGGPSGRPIYFGVDFDVPDYAGQLPNTPEHAVAKLGPIADYFRGCRDMLDSHWIGAYGGYWVIKRLFEANLISFGWQTIAWSGGQRYPRAALYQTGFHGSYDESYTDVPDFGQWRIGWRPGDAPTTVHPVMRQTKVWHKVKPGDTLSALAAAYGTSVQAIAALNPGVITDVNHIEVGWNIRIK